MKGLSDQQKIFLYEHDVSLDLIFDAKGLSKSQYQSIMTKLEKKIAFNVTPCERGGHTLRDKYGHCVQCETRNLAWIKRTEGYIYLAYSRSKKLSKIGYTENVTNREEKLNSSNYGNIKDWKIIFSLYSKKAAKIERNCHKKLKKFHSPRDYFRDGFLQLANEIFDCNNIYAKKVIDEVIFDFEKGT